MNSLTVVLLACKEEENLRILLPQIAENLRKIPVQDTDIMIVDSEKPLDNTQKLCEELSASLNIQIRYINQEYPKFGGAFVTAIKHCRKNLFLIMDADGSHNPVYIPDIYNKFAEGKYDLVIGSRYVKGGKTNDAKSNIILSHILNFVIRIIIGLKAHDISTDFRLYKTAQLKDVMKNLPLNSVNYVILQEILLKIKLRNGRKISIGEVPIEFNKRIYGESQRKLMKFVFEYMKSCFYFLYLQITYRSK
jgi:dolichol-phosphate mannosyltransferase